MKWLLYTTLLVFSIIQIVACAGYEDASVQHRIGRVEGGMLPAVLVSGEEPPPITIQDIMQRFNVPGVGVAVINDGVLEWAKGYGTLEVGGPEVNTETLFLAGHISQAVAAIGALKLVQAGSVSLDEDVNDQLDTWQVPDNEFTTSEKVTLRRILTHTSGLNVRSLLGYLPGESVPSLQQLLDGVDPATNQPIRVVAEPGSGHHYSVGSYLVLQQLLEDVSGQRYADFIASSVFTPLELERSFHTQPLPDSIASNAARGHEPTNEQVPGRWRIYPELASLGMWTTPTDLALLAVELQQAYSGESDRLLPQSLAEEMLSQQSEDHGLGIEFGGDNDWRHFRLEGHGNNYLTDLFAYVSQGMGAVVMTNSSNGEAVKAHILRAVATEYGWPDLLPERVEVVTPPVEALQELVGAYSFRGRDRILRLEQDRLIQSSVGSPDQLLLMLSEDLLISETFGYRYGVERDETGSVTGLALILDGTRFFTYEKTD